MLSCETGGIQGCAKTGMPAESGAAAVLLQLESPLLSWAQAAVGLAGDSWAGAGLEPSTADTSHFYEMSDISMSQL